MSLAIGLALTLLLGASSCGKAVAPTPLNVLMVGDGFSAARGVGDSLAMRGDDSCASPRGSHSYGQVLHGNLGSSGQFINAACDGAKTEDLIPSVKHLLEKMPGLASGIDLVLVTIGANDMGFTPMAVNCYMGRTPDDWQKCHDLLNRLEGNEEFGLSTTVPAAGQQIEALFNLFPQAQVVWLGYPQVEESGNLRRSYCLDDDGTASAAPCKAKQLTVNYDPVARIYQLLKKFEDLQLGVLKERVLATGQHAVFTQPVVDDFRSHGVGGGTELFINPTDGPDGARYRINTVGHRELAMLLSRNDGVRRARELVQAAN